MALVELRGREHEPEVRELLGSRAGAPDGCALLGWERDGRLAACVALERRSTEALAVRLLAFAPDADRVEIGRALFDALTALAAAARLVADVEPEAVELYRACGFALDGSGAAVRTIEAVPAAPEAIAAVTPSELEHAIRSAWGSDTSADPDEWSEANPARGQCDVTALLVRELLGGEILIANVIRAGRRVERHAWNRLPSGLTLDLTRAQFLNGEAFDTPAVQEPLAASRSAERLDLLRARVRHALGAPRRLAAGRGRDPRADMDAEEVVEIVGLLEGLGVEVWLDGGWGVDALLAEQTRPHDDLDLVVALEDVPGLREALSGRGYELAGGGAPASFELTDRDGRQVDVHPVAFTVSGDGVYRMRDGGEWVYPASGFQGIGQVLGRQVRCLTPEVQMLCHSGYELDAVQLQDVAALSRIVGSAS